MLEESDIVTIKQILKGVVEDDRKKKSEEYEENIVGYVYPMIMVVGISGVLAACFGLMYYGEVVFVAGCVVSFMSLMALITYENMMSTRTILKKLKKIE